MEEKFRKSTYEKAKSLLKTTLTAYCVAGGIYGFVMYASGQTTGHVSADIHLGLTKPTKIEKILMEEFGYEDKSHKNELNIKSK